MSLTKVSYSMISGAPGNALDYGADPTGIVDSHAAITAALAAHDEVLITGTPLIASTLVIPAHKKLRFLGGRGNTTGSYPPSYLIKKSTMTTTGVELSTCAEIEGGGLICQGGNTGNGVGMLDNSAKLRNFFVHGAGQDGIRVGFDAEGGNFNSCTIDNCTTQYNGRYGLHIHDGKAAVGADANAITVTQLFSRGNGSHGIYLGHCWWISLINCLTDLNTGWGLYISPTINGTVAESRYHAIIGGDYNESNTAGTASITGYACTAYNPDQNQLMTVTGSFCNEFGGSVSKINKINLVQGQIAFPAPQEASEDPNTLDDYEEGTFVPTVIGTTTAGTATYSLQQGRYTKIGRVVTIEVALIWTGGTGTGNLRIVTLPFVSNASTYGCFAVGQWANIALTAGNTLTAFTNGGTYISISQSVIGAGGAASNVPYSATGTILLTGSYTV